MTHSLRSWRITTNVSKGIIYDWRWNRIGNEIACAAKLMPNKLCSRCMWYPYNSSYSIFFFKINKIHKKFLNPNFCTVTCTSTYAWIWMHHVQKARGNLDLTKFLIKIQIIIICSLRRCEHVHTVWLPLYPDSGAIQFGIILRYLSKLTTVHYEYTTIWFDFELLRL